MSRMLSNTTCRARPARCALLMGLVVLSLAVLHNPLEAQQQRGKTGGAAAPAASSDLTERIQQLEAQIVEMRVVIDTLDSLARRGQAAGPPAVAGGGGFDGPGQGNARFDVLETQVRALTAQIEQLSAEVRSTGGRSGGSGAAPPSGASTGGWQTRPPQVDAGGTGKSWGTQGRGPEVRGFDARAGADNAEANRAYLQAINLYNQDDFQGARDAIANFVKTYPDHPQVPTAQFRLGQTNYKLAQYGVAAKQFWTVVRAFPNEPVAPDSFAMFAASLGRSGKTKDACEAYRQLQARYPNDAAHMPQDAKAEQSRLGC